MDESSRNRSTSKLNTTPPIQSVGKVEVDSVSNVIYNKKVTVKIQSLYDARLEYKGQVTGQLYTWNKAGSVVEVSAEDSEILLAKRMGGQLCCGNSRDTNKIFSIAN